ncbi:MAG: hypothetical protein IJR68_09625 [Fretibacterium sp.]|nr:hypothetical protein [Fretibacterium sp.]
MSVSVAAAEGECYFLDAEGNRVNEVKGDASNMTVVPYLTAGTTYEDAFITVDATEADQPTFDVLAEKAIPNPNGGENSPDSPTSNKGSGGCDAGLGVVALLAFAGLVATRKK